jgi:hypothetical protein
MGGFANDANGNDVTYCTNWDFRGVNPPLAQMLTDAQFMMGSTAAPHCRVGTIESSDGSITFTYSNPTSSTAKLDIKAASSGTDLHTAKWIVNPTAGAGGNQTTIAAAIAAASSGDTIFVMPGTTGIYTEDLTLKAGVNIVAFTGDGNTPNVTIVGKMTMTTAGTCTISNIRLQTNSDFFLAVTGTANSIVNLIGCYLNCANNTGISYTTTGSSSRILILNCKGIISTAATSLFAASSNGTLFIENTAIETGAIITTASTISSGLVKMKYCDLPFPFSASSTASVDGQYCTFGQNIATTAYAFTNTSTGAFYYCKFLGGSAAAINASGSSTVCYGCTIDSSNSTSVVSGSGSFSYGACSFINLYTVAATTQTSVYYNPGLDPVALPAGDYTVLKSDVFVGATTSAARAITLPSSPQKGERHTIKDITGTAATNNITITPAAGNIDGAANFVININFGAVTLLYNGTQWNVI